MNAMRLSELARVRFAARGGAVLLAALFCVLAAQRLPARFQPAGPPGPPAISVSVHARETPQARRPPVTPPLFPRSQEAIAAPRLASAGEGDDLRLWEDGAAGDIVFNSVAHLQRCRDARVRHRQAPDCPSAEDTRPFVLAETAEPGLRIERLPLPGRRRRR